MIDEPQVQVAMSGRTVALHIEDVYQRPFDTPKRSS